MLRPLRQALVTEKTAVVNQIRGFLSERGIILPASVNRIRKELPLILEDAGRLTVMSRRLFRELDERLRELDKQIREKDKAVNGLCGQDELSGRIFKVPGIGPLTATIIASELGNGTGYASGRDYAASLSVVPKQHGSGGRQTLLGIYPKIPS